MPNSLAVLMIALCPLITLAMYVRLPVRSAVIWSILLAYLWMPMMVELKLPGIPALSKHSIPALFGYLFAMAKLGRPISLMPHSIAGRILVLFVLLVPFLTMLTNGDFVFITNDLILPALRPYDAVSAMIAQLGGLFIWAIAREVLVDRAALRDLARALAVAMLWYTIPMLYEIRMSPQLHVMIYGFFQHDFLQMIRQGGFRPIVFLEHGLWVSILTAMATLMVAVLARDSTGKERRRWYLCTGYLFVVLVLSKSVGALVFALLLLPAVLMLSGKWMNRIAVLICVLVLAYPILRTLDVIPTADLVAAIAERSPDRAQSLAFRFDNEDLLLGHAMERPLFGWGGWQRNFVFDPETGRRLTIPDGLWVISMGVGGFMGFIGQFGLLTLPIFLLGGAFRKAGREVPVFAAGFALVLAANLADLLPNATMTPVTWLLSGGMLGYLERLRVSSTAEDSAPEAGRAPDPAPAGGRYRPAFAGLVGRVGHGPRSLI